MIAWLLTDGILFFFLLSFSEITELTEEHRNRKLQLKLIKIGYLKLAKSQKVLYF